ncbi:carboxylesterase family protein [Caballeronia sp. LP003]|uniref:carboxylesterase/lipase family protein n=1 Tax=Caballeronia sp. LP003 TaxID=3038551 RepID=UPI0028632198|nr:carboxylesterase family protein [Caballeronia sp. LP003]MDR5785321.1 carboxylesterase family protein [Caballeronia sp. LP003]
MQSEPIVVQTRFGKLEGGRENGLHVFRGVPFAKPPVGALRFCAPRPLEPWTGVRPATKSGPASVQMNLTNAEDVLKGVAQLDPGVPGIPAWPGYVGKVYNHEHIAEDCLYLDIWVPDDRPRGRLPVYVYFHGGANAVSSGSFAVERGENLAREEEFIVVRPNYRMGALGWVHFGLVSDEFPEAINLGVQDQVAALAWVFENIDAFGGDPENITIGGESAGATAVSHLLTYPPARRYFKRAILQSLSPFNVWCTQQQEEARFVANKYLELLKLDGFSQLHDIDPIRLLAVQNIMTRFFDPDANVAWRPLGGVIDGKWIPEAPAQFLAGSRSDDLKKPLMIGFAKDEWQFFRGHAKTIVEGSETKALAILSQVYGEAHARALYDGYRKLYPDHSQPGHTVSDIMSFEFFKFSSLEIARRQSSCGTPVHVFEFAYDLPGFGGYLRAVHTGDMPFLWRNHAEDDLVQWPAFDGADRQEIRRVSKEMGELYAAFIRDGQPGDRWRPYDGQSQSVLWFGKVVESRPNLLTAELDIFRRHAAESVEQLEALLVSNVRRKLDSV